MLGTIVLLSQALLVAGVQYTAGQFTTGTAPEIDNQTPYTGQAITLDTNARVLTLDYGTLVGGYPWIEVSTLDNGPVQVDLKYSEAYDGLWSQMGDGPW